MFSPVYTKQFAKDIKRQKRRGKNMVKFKLIAQTILAANLWMSFIETTGLLATMPVAGNAILNPIGF